MRSLTIDGQESGPAGRGRAPQLLLWRAGEGEKAACVCRRELTDASLAAVAHDQMRTVWEQLLTAVEQRAVSPEALSDLRRYLSVHWKHPATTVPAVEIRRSTKPESPERDAGV